MRFVNYYCCQNIRKYTPNDTLKALLPCSPAGYFSSVLHTGCTGSRPVLAWTLPYFPLYRKCTLKAPFYTITVCRLQQPCYKNINSFPLVSAAISIRFVPFCPILSYLDWRWIVYITILIYFHRTTNTVIYYCILLLWYTFLFLLHHLYITIQIYITSSLVFTVYYYYDIQICSAK